MDWQSRINIDPAILVGKPIVRGTRISVELVIHMLARGWSHDDIISQYPHLQREDILACLHYAHEMLTSEQVYLLPKKQDARATG